MFDTKNFSLSNFFEIWGIGQKTLFIECRIVDSKDVRVTGH